MGGGVSCRCVGDHLAHRTKNRREPTGLDRLDAQDLAPYGLGTIKAWCDPDATGRRLCGVDLVAYPGGNTFAVLDKLRSSGLLQTLRDRVRDRGGPYGIARRPQTHTTIDPDASTRYPVLYLLHGGLGGFRDWTDAGGIEALTAGTDLIIVMPSGGTGGWYRDWHDFGHGRAPRWETFHTSQLIGWVDDQLATRADAAGRAIAGQSMGGFGALSYAARHPELFTAAVSFSGAVDTRFPLVRSLICVSSVAHRRPPFAINRLPLLADADWSAHNPTEIAEGLRGLHLTITTGNGRPTRRRRARDPRPKDLQEHQVRAMSFSLHRRLDELGIEHTFRDMGNIGHTFDNWRRAFADELPALLERLDAATDDRVVAVTSTA